MIGKLEELVLAASMRAGSEAVANDIYGYVLNGHPKIAFGAVYTTLTRLAKKKLVDETSITDDQGRQRRGFTINGGGRDALQEALEASAKVGGWKIGGEYGLA